MNYEKTLFERIAELGTAQELVQKLSLRAVQMQDTCRNDTALPAVRG